MESLKITTLNTLFLPAKNGSSRIENKTKKLLVVLHGLGDSVEGYRFLPDLLGFSELSYLLVNAPDSYSSGYSWFDIMGRREPGIIRSRDKLFSLLRQVEEQGYSPANVSILGFSQGCLMAVDVGCRYPKKLGCIIGISGFVGLLEEYPERFSALAREQRFLITHGTDDPVLPISGAGEQFMALKAMGLQLEWLEYEKVHTIDTEAEISDIRHFMAKNLSLDLPR